jgi:rubrerythrin
MNPPLRGIVQLTNSVVLRFRNWSFNNKINLERRLRMKQKTSAVRKARKTDKEMSGKTGWRCETCGQIHYGDEPSDKCPHCLSAFAAFKEVGSEE